MHHDKALCFVLLLGHWIAVAESPEDHTAAPYREYQIIHHIFEVSLAEFTSEEGTVRESRFEVNHFELTE
jgi:hypothetical protein